MELIEVEVSVNFPEGKRDIEMTVKQPHEIENCKEGKVVCLNLKNNEMHTGFFQGMDGNYIKLGAIKGKSAMGYEVDWLFNYYEQKTLI